MKQKNKKTKIAVFFGGKISRHLVLIREAARELKADLELVSYNRVCFETEMGRVEIRGNKLNRTNIEDFDVLFFRTTGKHWEEVDLILNQISKIKDQKDRPIVVDPMVENGKPSYACKAWQMLKLKEAGIGVPRSIYGSLWYLYGVIKDMSSCDHFLSSGQCVTTLDVGQKTITAKTFPGRTWNFPVIIKGSGGDRGTRVYKADNLEELERLVRELRRPEIEEGRRYMLQEYIENEGDYRVLVLGKKVLGVMKRSRTDKKEFRNNFSTGGKVEVVDLPEEIKQLAVRAAEVCGLLVAGVDIMLKNKKKKEKNGFELSRNTEDYVVLEVNKGPQFWGFMKATGIDVPKEIVKFLISLRM